MKLGLTELEATEEVVEELNAFELHAIMAEEDAIIEAISIFEETESDEVTLLDQLQFISQILSASSDVASLEPVFAEVENFTGAFGEDSSKWKENVDAYLVELKATAETEDGEVSEEGMKIQDTLRWGLPGLIAGLLLAKKSSIVNRLVHNISDLERISDDEFTKLTKRTSQYLPTKEATMDFLEGINALRDIIESAISKGSKVSANDVNDKLKTMGIKTGRSSTTHTEWKVVGGQYAVGIIAGIAIGAITAPMFTAAVASSSAVALLVAAMTRNAAVSVTGLSNTILAKKFGEAGWSLEKKGWDNKADLIKAMKLSLKTYDDDSLKSVTVKLSKISKGDLTDEEKSEVDQSRTIVKGCIKAFLELRKHIGRGLAAV